ncbi:NAD(P)/FAD-dependent oxidoreductase [Pseudonocardia benzenivorans]|uniref:NAD(P)/FAD-dependent oxidoreductase n=1 Tax=Pseudonocardia benzenivorans TaxID=228005 RepID=A0ABW3VCL1_9PSEU
MVGTRVAGASTALLLARRGLSVLALDRARFPSDTVSTHQVQVPGGARLHRWGLLERLRAAGTPPARTVRFDAGPVVLQGRLPEVDGVDAVHSPRRTLLDAMLVDAAREAGAQVRERFRVEELVVDDDRVVGVRGRDPHGRRVTETAPIVVGADGRRSLVSRAVGSRLRHDVPPLTVASYTYWSGVPLTGGEVYSRPARAIGAWPTDDGLVMTYVAAPAAELGAFRADPGRALLRVLDDCGDLGERVRAGRREHPVVVTPDVPNRVHVPYGPGWALVGDAGLVMDPITGMGIADALRDAELLADAITVGLGGSVGLDVALRRYAHRHDAAAMPIWRHTTELARLTFRPEQDVLFRAIAERPGATEQFLAVLTGAALPDTIFGPRGLVRLLGVRGMVDLARTRRRRTA